MRKKTKVGKVKSYRCVVFFEELQEDVWLLSLAVNKSRRAINDWFNARKNKRYKKVENSEVNMGLSCLRVCLTLTKDFIEENPTASIITYHAEKKKEVMSKYLSRLGFVLTPMGDRNHWVLVAQKKAEE
jgi:hypothetical protein